MSDGIDKAASAFESAIGGEENAPSKMAMDEMFPHLSNKEEDLSAGGDNDSDYDGNFEKPKTKFAKNPAKVEQNDDFSFEDINLDDNEYEEIEEEDEEDNKPDDSEEGDSDEDGDIPKDLLAHEFEIVVDGEPQVVKLTEALQGYTRTKTFHQRMNKINEDRAMLQREAQVLVADRQKYITMIDSLQKQLDSLVPEEPDWDALLKTDPTKYASMQKQYRDYYTQRKVIDDTRAKVEREQQQAQEEEYKKYVNEENKKTLRLVKSWATDKKALARDFKSMTRTAKSVGFSDKEVTEVVDHRMIAILLKASRYDKMMASKNRITAVKTNPAKSGAGSKGTAPKALAGASRQLSKTGSIDDAADVFTQIIR